MSNPLDLSPEAVKEFWLIRHDNALWRIISSMEAVETWTLDGEPEFEAAVTKLCKTLENAENFELIQEDNFIKILTSLKASRALRLLQYLDSLKPGTASKLLVHAEVASNDPSDTPGFFLKRNLVFERLQLLGRVFAVERVKLVLDAIEKDET
jgi:intracellular multiplication protein IcmW